MNITEINILSTKVAKGTKEYFTLTKRGYTTIPRPGCEPGPVEWLPLECH